MIVFRAVFPSQPVCILKAELQSILSAGLCERSWGSEGWQLHRALNYCDIFLLKFLLPADFVCLFQALQMEPCKIPACFVQAPGAAGCCWVGCCWLYCSWEPVHVPLSPPACPEGMSNAWGGRSDPGPELWQFSSQCFPTCVLGGSPREAGDGWMLLVKWSLCIKLE